MTDLKWLESLKPGDEAVICFHNYGQPAYYKTKIDRRTPSGILIASGKRFSTDGWERGGVHGSTRCHLIKPDKDILDKIESNEMRTKIKGWIKNKLDASTSLDDLKKIWDLISKL